MIDGLVRFATLRKRISAKGNRYFSGLLGHAGLVLLKDRDEEGAWTLFISAREERPAQRNLNHHAKRERPKPKPKPQRPRVDPELDDPIPPFEHGLS